MQIFTVSLFGHRRIDDVSWLNGQLAPMIRELIKTKTRVVFLIGRNGEFDVCAASIIKRVQKEEGRGNSDIVLILPYVVADIEYYEKYYDGVIIPDSVCGAHPKAAVTLKNRWMADRSDLVITFVERSKGGAYSAKKYAEKQKKTVINLCRG